MSAIAILNIVLAVLIVAAIVSLLAWSIVADKAWFASHTRRALNAERPPAPQPAGAGENYPRHVVEVF